MNLTSLRDAPAIQDRHFLESLALGRWLFGRELLTAGVAVLDLGSGAGLPGIPLAIAWPAMTMSLLEATQKKARFLESVVKELRLSNTQVLSGRAEILAHNPRLRGAFNLVVARAVASLPGLVEMALPFLHEGGNLAAVKGSHGEEEVEAAAAALRLCGGRVITVERFFGNRAMQIVLITKVAATPKRYPRRPGQPASAPLGRAKEA